MSKIIQTPPSFPFLAEWGQIVITVTVERNGVNFIQTSRKMQTQLGNGTGMEIF